ncbi:MAG: ABC transporter permease [Candidatus Eremiobacteraeota bacterium]|nr:ABC transporter permease [Candidatus Eremiobacteraeota bacterium]MBC5827540.1 ABC transporter permease [Candidatus Eremiobacteraeota bacterium]
MLSSATVRSLLRRPSRTLLTILGIAIGVMALVTVGALAAQLRRVVSRSEAASQGVVLAFVAPEAFPRIEAQLPRLSKQLSRIPGVEGAVPEVVLPFHFGPAQRERFGPPQLIIGLPDRRAGLLNSTLSISTGSGPASGDERLVQVGSDFARSEDVGVGDVVSLYGSSYRVSGIYGQSFTVFDSAVFAPFEEAQRMVGQAVPAAARRRIRARDIATDFVLILKPGTDPSLVADRINLIDGFHATDPHRLNAGLETTARLFDSIIFGAALVALIIGALSVVNTMATAVRERTREIGIRKALGASDAAVLAEVMLESAAIGLLGGMVGLLGGAVLCAYLDARAAAAGSLQLFDLTPSLSLGALAFSTLLGAASGIAPAWGAARLNPTEALRRL